MRIPPFSFFPHPHLTLGCSPLSDSTLQHHLPLREISTFLKQPLKIQYAQGSLSPTFSQASHPQLSARYRGESIVSYGSTLSHIEINSLQNLLSFFLSAFFLLLVFSPPWMPLKKDSFIESLPRTSLCCQSLGVHTMCIIPILSAK